MEFKQPDFDGTTDSSHDAPKTERHDFEEHANENIDQSGNGMDSHETRNESVATAVEGYQPRTDPTSMDKIDTALTSDERNGSTTKPKDASHSHRKIYLHHRNKRGLSKLFTAGSAFDHLPFLHHDKHKGANVNTDPEAQGASHGHSVSVGHNFYIMLTTVPYWNMAFWSGWCYSIGSALFIISSCFSWVPLAYPKITIENLVTYGGPLTFFFGACLYQIGGVMAYLEAVNDGSFAGAAMKRLLEGHQDIEKELLDAKLHTFFGHLVPHHHHEDDEDEKQRKSTADAGESNWDSVTKGDSQPEDIYNEAKERVDRRTGVDMGGAPSQGEVREYLAWRWWPTWHSLFHYHIFELGYVACTIQLFGVTLYGVTSVVILPGILDSLAWWQELAAYWIPQVVASCCFIIASIMFTVMAQDKWNKPKWGAVSWWIGIHALIGSVGFL